MCDYSLHHVATRPAKIEDKLVATKFNNSITRGFAAVGEPTVAVCLLPGTEVAFVEGSGMRTCFSRHSQTDARGESGAVSADQHGRSEDAPRRAGISQRTDRTTHPAVRRPACDRAAVAGRSAHRERSGSAETRGCRRVVGPLAFELAGGAREQSHRGALILVAAGRGAARRPLTSSTV